MYKQEIVTALLQKIRSQKAEIDELNLRLPDTKASAFLIKRKLPYGNTMRAIFNKHPGMWETGVYHKCQIFLHEGYMLAVRRLKNNSL